ncbi:MAG: hypothetical protein BroJett003_27030 [Planctomycetota bacterium]|nr:MAG: hypothetical protein BroJett003_27030 [Planctomycetota bacterium]
MVNITVFVCVLSVGLAHVVIAAGAPPQAPIAAGSHPVEPADFSCNGSCQYPYDTDDCAMCCMGINSCCTCCYVHYCCGVDYAYCKAFCADRFPPKTCPST